MSVIMCIGTGFDPEASDPQNKHLCQNPFDVDIIHLLRSVAKAKAFKMNSSFLRNCSCKMCRFVIRRWEYFRETMKNNICQHCRNDTAHFSFSILSSAEAGGKLAGICWEICLRLWKILRNGSICSNYCEETYIVLKLCPF